MFYYVILAATVAAFALCHFLLRSRVGYFWLAIREDEAGGARRRHRHLPLQDDRGDGVRRGDLVCRRVLCVLLQQSVPRAGVRHLAARSRSFSVPIIGGVGTLFGPILGAFVITGLAETLTSAMSAYGLDLPGAKQVFDGVCLLIVIVALPEGVWPPLARRLGVTKEHE